MKPLTTILIFIMIGCGEKRKSMPDTSLDGIKIYPNNVISDTTISYGKLQYADTTIFLEYCDSIDWKHKYDSLLLVLKKCRERPTKIEHADKVIIGGN